MKFSVKAQSADAALAHQKLEYLDLGNLGVERIQKLEKCVQLNTLIFRGNNLDFVDNLENCRQLWNLDLSYNKIAHIDGLCRFVAFGLLDLSFNQLKWPELVRLRHIHVLELHLFGNPDLEKDVHYRTHVIDCLPNVWSLDGKLITSFERLQTEQFFHSSALSSHPVRHKISHNVFKPSDVRQIQTKGIFSVRADNLLKSFGRNAALNVDLDRRRAMYLFDNAQHDVLSHLKRTRLNKELSSSCAPLDDIKQVFSDSPLHARTLLLLLLAGLDFPLPTELIDELLNGIGRPSLELSVLVLLTLPVGMRVRIASLLFNLFKVERDAGCDDHLTASLYLSVHAVLTDRLMSTAEEVPSALVSTPHKRYNHRSQAQKVKAYQHILAEFVSLLLPYASFLDYVRSDPDVGHLLTSALGDEAILAEIEQTISNFTKHGVDKMQIYQTLINDVLLRIRAGFASPTDNTRRPRSQRDLHLLNASQSIPRKTVPNALFVTDFLAAGRACPDRAPMNLKLGRPPRRPFITAPKLGDSVLLGPQVVGKLVAKPDPETFLVYSDVIPEPTGALVFRTKDNDQHYVYVTLVDLEWDKQGHYWRPRGTVGDKLTVHKEQEDVEPGTSMALVEVTTVQQGARPSPLPSARPLLALPPPPDSFVPLTLDMKAKSAKVRPLASSTDHGHPVPADHAHQHAVTSPKVSPRPPSHSSGHHDSLKKSSRAGSARQGDITARVTPTLAPLPDIGQVKPRDKSPSQHRSDSATGSRPHSCPMCSEPTSPRDAKVKDTVVPTQSVFLTLANVEGPTEEDASQSQGQDQSTHQAQAGQEGDQQAALNLQLVPVMSEQEQQEEKRKQAELVTPGSQKATSRSNTGRRHLAKMQPVNLRRMASLSASGARVVLAASGGVLVSDRQNSALSPQKPRDGAPPQRPSSPSQRAMVTETEAMTVLPVRTVNRWLAAGRDVHEEAQNKRPSTDHVPGWLADRPASMTMPVTTDTCYHDHHDHHQHQEEDVEPAGVRPVFHSAPLASRGFAGNALVPTADQLYKARLGRQKAFKCEECRHRDMLRQAQLLEQLFGTDDGDDDGEFAVNGLLL